MKVLHIIASVDARDGGPVEALRCLGKELEERGIEQTVLTLDLPDSAFAAEFPLPVYALGDPPANRQGAWAKFRNWLSHAPRALAWGKANLHTFDAAVVHGLWNGSTRLSQLLLRNSALPYAVYPHGMLDPWFRRRYPLKHLAKQVLWLCNEGPLLKNAAAVLFTCEQERLLARRNFYPYSVREQVVAFGTEPPPPADPAHERAFRSLLPALGERRYLLFLGRLHEKKGCDLLIKAFARVAAEHPELDLVIAGPDDVGLRPSLERLARAEGVADRIHWPGMVTGFAKFGAYRGAEAFVLPSHQENFGIVVAEALACSCPVLLSNQVNIWREVVASNAGLCADDTMAGTEDILRRFLCLTPAARVSMRNAGLAVFNAKFTAHAAGADLERVLERAARAQSRDF